MSDLERLEQNPSARTGEVRTVATGFSFLEAPRWHDGALVASDFYSHRVLEFTEHGTSRVICEVPGEPAGTGWAPDGSMMVVSMLDRKVLRFADGGLEELADLQDLTRVRVNEMTVDAHGRAYIGDFGFDIDDDISATNILRLDPDGTLVIAAPGVVFPNGMVIPDGGKQLLVAETFACQISSFDIAADGSLSNRQTWARFSDAAFATPRDAIASGAVLPDGLAGDADGALWVADANGHGAIRVREGGEVLDRVDTGDLAVYGLALGGTERRTLYMCAAPPLSRTLVASEPNTSVLLACQVDVPGAGLP